MPQTHAMPRDCTQSDEGDAEERQYTDKDLVSPLPKLQLFVVLLMQLAEPVTASFLYPFVNRLVVLSGVTKGDERKAGYYVGLLDSAFFGAECLTVVIWGSLAEVYGRRPVLLIAPLGLGVAVMMMGMSVEFWPILICRALQGVFNGNLGVSKTVMAEITDETNVGDAYAFVPFVWSIGSTIGPIIGGFLVDLPTKWSHIHGRDAWLTWHPYFLACSAVAFISLAGFVAGCLALRETHPSLPASAKGHLLVPADRSHPQRFCRTLIEYGETMDYGTIPGPRNAVVRSSRTVVSKTTRSASADVHTDPKTDMSLRSLLNGPLFLPFISYGSLNFINMCYTTLLPIVYSTSVSLGGLGLTPMTIGAIMGFSGFINAVVQLRCLGGLLRQYGARNMFITSFSSLVLCLSIYPFLSMLARRSGKTDWLVGIGIGFQLGLQISADMAEGSMQVLIIEETPRGAPLATVNGLAQMIESAVRALAPMLASSLFSISLTKQLAGGQLVYFVLVLLGLVGVHISMKLPQRRRRG